MSSKPTSVSLRIPAVLRARLDATLAEAQALDPPPQWARNRNALTLEAVRRGVDALAAELSPEAQYSVNHSTYHAAAQSCGLAENPVAAHLPDPPPRALSPSRRRTNSRAADLEVKVALSALAAMVDHVRGLP